LEAEEVAVNLQAGSVATSGSWALFAKLPADGIAAPALPDDGVVERPSRRAVEDEHRLALVGQAQAGGCGQAVRVARGNITNHGEDILPDFLGVVFDPTRLRIDLLVRA